MLKDLPWTFEPRGLIADSIGQDQNALNMQPDLRLHPTIRRYFFRNRLKKKGKNAYEIVTMLYIIFGLKVYFI